MKLFFKIIANLSVQFVSFLRNLLAIILYFFKRVKKSALLMNKTETIFSLFFLICALVLSGIKVKDEFFLRTRIVPADGGIYKEVVFGDFKYLNPLLASTDAEKSSSKLVFSGLVKYDKNNNVTSDIAEKWEISPDNLRYTFYLKDNVVFHDGKRLTADDVAFTVDKIKNPAFKSPLSSAWEDVNVTTEGNKVIFDLPRAYGPFIYNCDFGILPSHLSDDQFNKKLVGTGPYKFANSTIKNGKIVKLNLEKNPLYFNGEPYISQIELDFFGSKAETELGFKEKGTNAISGMSINGKESLFDLSFKTNKRLGLIFNLRKDKLKDKTVRQKILSSDKLPDRLDLSLTTLDNDLQRSKAEELKKQFSDRNINLSIKYLNPIDMQEALSKKDYELLLFGFDFGYDPDPYVFWHSSQMENMNFAGFSDKNSDILLEDARMLTDYTARNAKYNQFFDTIKNEALGVFYDPITFSYEIKSDVKNAKINASEVDYRYDGIEKWYIKEKRVRK
ncbi:MAG: ABC transporter substrate-binding protein [Patescibacteria group bacterium]|nr:ABC transporter substrate-binding protein [Patescibacteria group bacterium]